MHLAGKNFAEEIKVVVDETLISRCSGFCLKCSEMLL